MDKRANPQKDYPVSIFDFSGRDELLEEDLYSENQHKKKNRNNPCKTVDITKK